MAMTEDDLRVEPAAIWRPRFPEAGIKTGDHIRPAFEGDDSLAFEVEGMARYKGYDVVVLRQYGTLNDGDDEAALNGTLLYDRANGVLLYSVETIRGRRSGRRVNLTKVMEVQY